MKNYHLYLITNKINNKKYVGITRYGYLVRWKYHQENAFNEGRPREYNSTFYRALRKYGFDNFEVAFLVEGDSWDHLCDLETNAIIEHNSHYKEGHGYNMTYGRNGVHGHTWKWTEEQIANRPNLVFSEQGLESLRSSKMGSKNPNARNITIEGIKYGSASDASRMLGIGVGTIRFRLKDPRFPKYQYIFDDADERIQITGNQNGKSKPIIVSRQEYVSIVDASRQLGISKYVIRNRLYDKKFPEYQFKE